MSYKLTFVHSAVRPSVRSLVHLLPAFLEIGSLGFSDFWHKGAKWQCPICDGAWFSGNAGKIPEKPVFGLFIEILSLVFSDFLHKDA